MPLWIRRIIDDDTPLTLNAIASKSLLVHTTVFLAHSLITVKYLIDSGCSARGFADQQFLQKAQIPTARLPRPRSLILADGKAAAQPTDYVILDIGMEEHMELCVFFVTDLSDQNRPILGMPWLQRHNPHIDWPTLAITFNSQYFPTNCSPRDCTAPTIPAPVTLPHDVIIPGEPRRSSLLVVNGDARVKKKVRFQVHVEDALEETNKEDTPEGMMLQPGEEDLSRFQAYVEDIPEQATIQLGERDLHIDYTLTPGLNYYRTYQPNGFEGPESRAQMIPNKPSKPILTTPIAGSRRRSRRCIPARLPEQN